MKYRADVDGLRAIAVSSVVLYHYGATWLPGGFVGVDVFFVISGYLITRNLVEQIETRGLSIVDFYSRRIRRIFPALAVVLATTLALGYWFLMPGDYTTTSKSAVYSVFGFGNFYFAAHTGYFDRSAELQPLLHMWSLGVEEQFYLAWPLLLALFLKRGRGAATCLIVAVILVSFVTSVALVASDPKVAFYMPHTRAWELAAGALLVFVPAIGKQKACAAASLAGLVLIIYSFFALRVTDPFPGWNAVAPVSGAALLLWSDKNTSVSRLLSTAPLRFLGLISYSLYLWHWPVLVLFRTWALGQMPTTGEAIALALFAVALSYLTWRFVELPCRRVTRPFIAITGGFAGAMTVAAAGFAIILAGGVEGRVLPQAQAMSSLDVMWKWNCPRTKKLEELAQPYCNFGKDWNHAPIKAILWGDSHAEHMAPIVEAANGTESASFLLYRECPANLGGHVRRVWSAYPNYVKHCAETRSRAIELLRQRSEINLVILAASWSNLSRVISQDGSRPGRVLPHELIQDGIRSLIEATARPGRYFLIIADVPQLRGDPVPCAVAGYSHLFRRKCEMAQEAVSRSYFDNRQGLIYQAIAEIAAERNDTRAIFPGKALCGSERCETTLNGEFLYRDASHIRRNLRFETKRALADRIGLSEYFLHDARDLIDPGNVRHAEIKRRTNPE